MGTTENCVNKYSLKLKEKIKNLVTDRSPKCRDCYFAYICGGVCMHHAYVTHGKIFDNVPMECKERNIIFKEGLNLLCSLNLQERRQFLLFLSLIWQKNNLRGGEIYA